jgi:hypothetical protein
MDGEWIVVYGRRWMVVYIIDTKNKGNSESS